MTDNSFDFYPDSFASAIFLQAYNKYSIYAPIFSNSAIFDALFCQMIDFSNKIYQQYNKTQDIEIIKSLLEQSIKVYLETVADNVSRQISVDQYITKTQILTSTLASLIDENNLIEKPFSYTLIKTLLMRQLSVLNDPELVSMAKITFDSPQTSTCDFIDMITLIHDLILKYKQIWIKFYHSSEGQFMNNMITELCSIAGSGVLYNLQICNDPETRKLFSPERVEFLMEQICWSVYNFGSSLYWSEKSESEGHSILKTLASEIWVIVFASDNQYRSFEFLKIMIREKCFLVYTSNAR